MTNEQALKHSLRILVPLEAVLVAGSIALLLLLFNLQAMAALVFVVVLIGAFIINVLIFWIMKLPHALYPDWRSVWLGMGWGLVLGGVLCLGLVLIYALPWLLLAVGLCLGAAIGSSIGWMVGLIFAPVEGFTRAVIVRYGFKFLLIGAIFGVITTVSNILQYDAEIYDRHFEEAIYDVATLFVLGIIILGLRRVFYTKISDST